MNETLITKINGVDIRTVERDGEIFVPVKPICQALTIDFEGQRQRIARHYILGSTAFTVKAVASDEKEREMLCLPLEYIYGWLFTIDAGQVAESCREAVATYQLECYKVLYNYFTGTARRAAEQARAEADLLRQRAEYEASVRECRQEIKQIDEKLEQLKKERINPQPTLF